MSNEELLEKISEYIYADLTEKRKTHTKGVYDTAIKLAEVYGEEPEKAGIAALFHDVAKNMSTENMDYYVKSLGMPKKYIGNPNLAHGKIASFLLKEIFEVKDQDILNAISFHTTGRPNMSLLEKIVYIADAIEPGRSYPGVEELREIAFRDIDLACHRALTNTISLINGKGIFLDEDTLKAKEYFENILNKRGEKKMTNREFALLAGKTLSDKKALDVAIIDIQEKASFADYFVVASGTSERQINTLIDYVEDAFAKEGLLPKSVEGKNNSGWILMDFGDIIVNLFTNEMREKYNIEKVWGDCPSVDFEENEE